MRVAHIFAHGEKSAKRLKTKGIPQTQRFAGFLSLSGGFNSDIFYIALDLHISFYLKYDKIEITKAVREINIGP